MIPIYTAVIRYFLLMFLMLLITGIWLLLSHTSLSVESFTNYYVEKSFFGLLEIITPHLFAMGTTVFILTHLLSLNKKNTPYENKLSLVLFTLMLLSNFSLFFITEESTWMVWIKLISTILFFIFSLLSIYQVLLRTHKPKLNNRKTTS
ncbi:MAG: Unknown protein [uncultured Sulfurovum sp.]|uniref:Uncharacterized protein n=1 Tax=uncultured Sulfurovum sp. TaxID=269237 RepID=A0A6S6SU02_9BACT|nr:MAG: Unknown protein [uncultured Sulfurovum sp.]